ncbi:MAG TPA: tripartite tricarboxylate transporter permease [Candidatus Limnocylindria bacterium]|nr:tripartite tricarboxylate transporter permease [Candidatus Limnocylindria bacterium]
MEALELLRNGFAVAIEPQNLLFAFIGCALGTAVGVLPGIGSAAAIAILLPVTFNLAPTPAIIMLAAIFYGTNYGGTITSVLMNMPGEAASVVTCMDGYEMAKRGRAGAALAIAAIGSFIGGTVATIGLVLSAELLTRSALQVGAPEYFALLVLGMALLTGLASKSFLKSVMMAVLGLLLATVGMDPTAGSPRFTFGRLELLDGLSFVPVVMGLFGIGEILINLEVQGRSVFQKRLGSLLLTRDDIRQSVGPITRGTLVGFVLGLIPGATSVIASFLSYSLETKVSRTPERFGKGAIEGVAAPETANNSFVNANFIPLFALGIPGTASVAMIMGGMMANGLVPGPFLYRDHADFVWAVIASMYIGNVILLILNLPLVGLWVKLLDVPYSILFAAILGFTTLGAYAVSNSPFDIFVMLVFGFLGYAFKKLEFPIAPLVLTLILGPLMERNLRKSLEMGGGDFTILFDRPLSLAVLLIAAALALLPLLRPLWGRVEVLRSGQETS